MNLDEFSSLLALALSHPHAADAVRRLVRTELTREAAFTDGGGRDLVGRLAERLDANGESDEQLLSTSRSVHALVVAASSAIVVEQLLEVVIQSPRLCQVLEGHLAGRLSRTSLLSFFAKQGWSPEVKHGIARLTRAELEVLSGASMTVDVRVLESLLLR